MTSMPRAGRAFSPRRLLHGVPAALSLLLAACAVPLRVAGQSTSVSVLVRANGAWGSAATWNPAVVPNNSATTGYLVSWTGTNASQVTLDGAYRVSTLGLASSGTLQGKGTGSLKVDGTFDWLSGIVDQAALVANGPVTWKGAGVHRLSGGSLALNGPGRVVDHSLELVGGAMLVVNDSLDLADGTVVTGQSPVSTGGGRIQNFGTLGHLFGTGSAQVGPGIVVENFGHLWVNSGSLSVSSFSQSDGSLNLSPGATFSSQNPVLLRGGVWQGGGTVVANVDARCAVEPGFAGGVGVMAVELDVRLAEGSVFTVDVLDAQTADRFDVAEVLTLAGALRVRLLPGASSSIDPSTRIVFAHASQLVGQFANVVPGGRVATENGEGTFRVDYAGSNQTAVQELSLTDFQANPVGRFPVLKLPYLVVYGRGQDAGDTDGTVWLAAADGSMDVKLLYGSRPRLSADRQRVLFLKSGQTGPNPDIWAKTLVSGGEDLLLTADPAESAGPTVAAEFAADATTLLVSRECSVISRDPSGQVATLYKSGGCSLGAIARQRNGSLVVAADASRGIVLLDAAASVVGGSLPGDSDPAWSADGALLAVARGGELAVLDPAKGVRRRLFPANAHFVEYVRGPAWTPDGLWVIAAMYIDGEEGLFAVASDGSGTIRRLPVGRGGPAPETVGAVVALDPFPDVHWSVALEVTGPVAYLANVLDLPSNTIEGWLDGLVSQSPVATATYVDGSGVVRQSVRDGTGPWTPNAELGPGSGAAVAAGAAFRLVSEGRLAVPRRLAELPSFPAFFGMRAPQEADFATLFGFTPPEGTALLRTVLGTTEQLLFKDGAWKQLVDGTLRPVSPPVAGIGEAWRVKFGGPGLYSHPENLRVTLGTPAEFRVEAVGVPPLKYQWFRVGLADTKVDGATGPTLPIPAVRAEDLGAYRVEVADANGTVSSRGARLAADATLAVLSVTASAPNPVPLGGALTLAVSAVGNGPLSYQWFRNGQALSGETADTLVLASVGPGSGGVYAVRVSDASGSVLSGPLAVLPAVPAGPFSDAFLALAPGNPNFTNTVAGDGGAVRGDNLAATAEPGELPHAGAPARNSVWVSWVPSASGIATFDTAGSSFDTRLAAYRGPLVAEPTVGNLLPLAGNDDTEPGVHTSQVRFDVVAGRRYFIAVDGAARQRGMVVLSWSLEATTQLVPRYATQTSSQNATPGQPLQLSVGVVTDPSAQPLFTWFRDGTPVAGATGGALDLGTAGFATVGKYVNRLQQVYPDGSVRVVQSAPIDVQLFQRSNGTDPGVRAFDRLADARAQFGTGGGSGAAKARAGRPVGLSRGVSGVQVFSTVGETLDPGEPALCGVAGGASKWYPLFCDTDGVVTVDTHGSTFDTVLAVYYDTGTSDDPYGGLRQVACDDDSSTTDKTSSVTFCARAGNAYLVAVDGVGGASGTVKLNYVMSNADPKASCAGPSVDCPTRPANRVAAKGATVVLSVAVSGTEPLVVDWYRDNQLVQTGPASTLALAGVDTAAAGKYRVRVSNPDGVAEAVVGRLTVVSGDQPGLGFTQECDGSITFEIAGGKGVAYALEASTDLLNWTQLFTGSSTNGMLTLPVLDAAQNPGRAYRARKL